MAGYCPATMNEFSTVIASSGPAFQECTGSYPKNVPAPKAVSSNLGSTDGQKVLASTLATILQHFTHTIKLSDPLLLADVILR